MAADLLALTISLDGIYIIPMSIQIILCIVLLIRSGQSYPPRTAIFVLLGGITLLLAGYATTAHEDSMKTGIPFAHMLNEESIGLQIAESLLATFGFNTVMTAVLLMLYQSGKDTKSESRMGKVVAGGAFVLLAELGLNIGSAAYTYNSNLTRIHSHTGLLDLDSLWKDYVTYRGLSITSLVVNAALIVILVLGGLQSGVQRLRSAILFGLIPTFFAQLTLSTVIAGLYYSGQHMDIFIDPAYIYTTGVISNVLTIIIPACALYAGWGWSVAPGLSSAAHSSEEHIGKGSLGE